MKIKRGEVYTTNLIEKDTKGVEIGKKRPTLVVQADLWNQMLPSTVVVPITSRVPTYTSAGTVVLNKTESGLEKDSTLLVDQLRSIDQSRLKKKIGKAGHEKMLSVDKALSLTLGLEPIE